MCMNYLSQLEFKKQVVKDAFLRIGGIEVNPEIIGMNSPERYRNKMVFPIGTGGSWGFYRQHSHDVIPLNDCLLGGNLNPKIMNTITEYAKIFSVSAYNEAEHSGVLRRVFIRSSQSEIMVVISVNSDFLPHSDVLINNLRRTSDNITSIILNINKKRTNLVLGDKNLLLWGKSTISSELCGLKYDISANSFFQVNTLQTEHLYETAIGFADISPNDTVMDIYCGIGTISLTAAKSAKSVIGIEIVPQAILDAKENALKNKISNADFFCGSTEELVPELIIKGQKPDIIMLDPPRKGSDKKTLSAIVSAAPKRIVYVSCNPATLARDARFLTEHGYLLEKATAVDMFPHTTHVETVVLLSQQKPDDVIEVDLDLDELDITSAESKATYQEIKDYVLKEFGLKVSTLYISQIKRKCGIEVGEHYNFSQKENQRVPQCPKEKEDAIRAALEHFAMI